MKTSRLAALAVVALVALSIAAASHATEPSAGCGGGPVPPSTTPLGVGVYQAGDPTTGALTLRLCNTGAQIPPPLKGAITVQLDPTHQRGFIDIDGDSNNNTLPCTDGFIRIKIDSNGPHFYDAPSGGYSTTSHERTPDQFVQDQANNCSPV